MFENIVAAFWENGQFTVGKTAKKCNPLLDLKKMAPVRIHHQARARNFPKFWPQVKHTDAIASPVPTAAN